MNPTTAAAPISVPRWTWLLVLAAVLVVQAVTLDNGMLLGHWAEGAHELFHDARHFIGAPCH